MTTDFLETTLEATEAPVGTETESTQAAIPEVETPEADPVEDHFKGFLKEQGLETSTETSAEVQNPDGKLTPEEAEDLARTRVQQERTQTAKQQSIVSYRNAISQLDNWATANLTPQNRNALMNTMNWLHSQTEDAIRTDWVMNQNTAFANRLPQAERKAFLEARGSDQSFDDLASAFEKAITKDRLTPAQVQKQVKAEVAKALATYKDDLATKGLLPGSKAPRNMDGASAGGQFSNEAALNRAFNNNSISRETYGREYKRLTGKNP